MQPSILVTAFWAVLGGMAVGATVNFAEIAGLPGASDFGNYFGLWIVLVAVIVAASRERIRAVVHAGVFLLGMVAAYYGVTWLLLGYFLVYLFLAWTMMAVVLAPPFAVLVWQARKLGWLAALGAALPIGLLLGEAYSLRWVLHIHGVQFVFNLVAAAVLIWILPKTQTQRLRSLVLTPGVMLAAGVLLAAVSRFAESYG
jgi:hypothetical protein